MLFVIILLFFFQNCLFHKSLSGIPTEWQTTWKGYHLQYGNKSLSCDITVHFVASCALGQWQSVQSKCCSFFFFPTVFLFCFFLDLRNRSAPAVNCWVIIHCLEVSCKEDQITSAQREWFIVVQLTDKQWIITQQFTHWSWSISILTHNKRPKHIRSLQLLPTFRHCTEELPPILRLRRIPLHVIVTSFKRKNDVTPSNAMNDVII